jgi:hypothetical protein
MPRTVGTPFTFVRPKVANGRRPGSRWTRSLLFTRAAYERLALPSATFVPGTQVRVTPAPVVGAGGVGAAVVAGAAVVVGPLPVTEVPPQPAPRAAAGEGDWP